LIEILGTLRLNHVDLI